MERSDNRTLKAYDYLAYYYDLLLGDEEAFSYWLDEIEKEKFNTILELASGSGVMAKILKEKGCEVIASDISESMKEASKVNFDGEYLILNMIFLKKQLQHIKRQILFRYQSETISHWTCISPQLQSKANQHRKIAIFCCKCRNNYAASGC